MQLFNLLYRSQARLTCLLALCLIQPSVVSAAEDGTNTPEMSTLPSVQVTARAAAPIQADSYQPTPDASTLRTTASILDTAQVVNIVPAQVIRDQRPRNLDDALANVSGITQGNTLAGTQDTMLKRGFGGNRDGSIMHNGMPLVQGRGLNAAAESVEVLKGPSALLYGIMDPGGVVNVVSKKPQLQPRRALSLLGSGYAGGRYGSGATLDMTAPIGENGLAWRLVADHVDEDYWRNFGTQRETLIAPSLAWYGEHTQAVLWIEYRDYTAPFDRGTALDPRTQRPLAIPKTRRLDEPFNEMTGTAYLGQLSLDHAFNAFWSAHLNLSYNREAYDANQLRINGINTTNGTLARSNDATRGALSTDSYGTVYIDGVLEIGDTRHELQWGADAEYRRIYRADLLRQKTLYDFSYWHPEYGREVPSSTVSANDSDQTNQLHNQSLFVQDNIHLNERWIVSGGLRYLSWRQTAGRGRPFKANTRADGNKWLPRVGLIYKANDTVALYGSYSQSLKPTATIAPLASGKVIDASVAPEAATAWEAGVKWDVPGRVTATLALFDIRKKNVLVSQYNDTSKLTDWRTSGAARSRGVEIDLAGQLSTHWSAIASSAWLDAKTTQDPVYQGNRLWNVARKTASLSLVYDFGWAADGVGRVRVGGGGQHVGKRPGDSANTFGLSDYTIAHAFITYDTRWRGETLCFQLNVKNLFDKTYYPSAANKYFVAMGAARQIALRMAMDF